MKTPAIIFNAPGQVALGQTEIDPAQLRADQVLIDTEASVISPGTELAILSGKEGWAPLPYIPGYGAVGRIAALGADAGEFVGAAARRRPARTAALNGDTRISAMRSA